MKIFFLTPRVPYPIDKGDKLRAFYQIKYLSKNHQIYLFALDENCSYSPINDPLLELCNEVQVIKLTRVQIIINLLFGLFRSIPLQTSYYYSKKIKDEIDDAIKQFKPDLIYCQLIRSAEYVREINSITKIIDYVDVISKGLSRRAEKSNMFLKLLLRFEYKRAVKYEKLVYDQFDKSIIITEEDRNLLPFVERNNVNIIPNGIDTEYYAPIIYEKKYDLFFSGNLRYPPNINSAKYIVHEILPLVKKEIPHIKVLIAGAAPNNFMFSLQSESVDIKGWIDDVRDYYKTAKIFVAPMQIGTGLQNKLLQAMAMKLPCVTSDLTRKGIAAREKNILLVAETPAEYTNMIIKLLKDEKYADDVANRGYDYIKATFDWVKIIGDLENIFVETVKNLKVVQSIK